MFKNMKLRARFTAMILTVYFLSLPIITIGGYIVLKRNAINEIMEEANLMLAAMESVRGYTAEVLRPKLQQLLPGRFVIEGMSATKVAYGVKERIRKKLPRYDFREATESPLNLKNQADDFELQKIQEFREGKLDKEWRGFKKSKNGEYYVIMRPVKVKPECLKCHGDPDMAPEEVVEKYGRTHGYRWKPNDIVAVNTIYVPSEVPIGRAQKVLVIFTAVYSGIFFIILLIINRLIVVSIIKPVEELAETAEEVSKGKLNRTFEVKTNDEIKTLAKAFDRMRVSLIKAIDAIRKK